MAAKPTPPAAPAPGCSGSALAPACQRMRDHRLRSRSSVSHQLGRRPFLGPEDGRRTPWPEEGDIDVGGDDDPCS